ncbi:(-)-germacrene D synthase-like [Juglans microcarpa x Juglans regia]|uniref:(-)-germacrene D synthase-like n=1 Tax=Juglans microcarpa x Juglans regia TaxID=2249226 RepID=UPI001B7E530B|nr:(-)-germacrene D synthase-like [Juglans microcarpa x Juglans regia]
MSIQVSAVPASIQNIATRDKSNRSLADYHPTIWGVHFLSYASDDHDSNMEADNNIMEQLQESKEELKRMLMAPTETLSEKLGLIDAIQRLGVSYHFESEIDEILQEVHTNPPCFDNSDKDDDLNLCTIALWFRLLRQQGYNVSCDIFNEFKDEKGDFKASLISDVNGMLSLYEAAHLGLHGEDILDEALAFTTTHLESAVSHDIKAASNLQKKVTHALNRPIRKGLPRLEGIHYISIYQEEDSHNKTLLNFAKLDFNVVQAQHQKEVCNITKWWKNLDFATKLPYARDRIVECCFWIMGVYFEPQYSLARRILIKVMVMTSIIDDTYDAFASYEEVELFTEAIERWDVSAIDLLPEYMKPIYRALLDIYDEIEAETAKEGRSFCVHYAKEAMKKVVQAYHVEAKWCHESFVPTMEEYMRIALVTSAYSMLATTSFVGMGNIANREVFEWISNGPKIVTASTIICRLMDDIASHKFEQKREHVASAVECYMKQYGVSAEEEVYELFQKEVSDAWKDINQGFLKPTAVPMPILERVLNFTRVIDVIYKEDDGYTNSHMLKDYITSLLVNPLLI